MPNQAIDATVYRVETPSDVFDWDSLPDDRPTSTTPLQDWADDRNQAINQTVGEAIDRTLEPITQLQQQVSQLQAGIESLNAQQKAAIERRSVLLCLGLLFGGVFWIQIGHPAIHAGMTAAANIKEQITGSRDTLSMGQRIGGAGVLENQTCITLKQPSAGKKTDPFGMRIHPISGESKMHYGLDLADAMGSPIMAAAAGRVVMAGDQGGLGTAIEIDHGKVGGSKIATRYGHLSELLVKEGDLVSPGQIIGKEGSSGNSTGPHLHFEVYLNDQPTDPEQFINKNWGEGCSK